MSLGNTIGRAIALTLGALLLVCVASDAAAIGFQPSVWTIMRFDFGAPVADMGQTS